MRPPIFFIHPPKSGGSTVISFFDLNKGKDQFVNFVWEKDNNWDNSRAKLWESGVGGGHQIYGIHRGLKAPLTYCTILRDPLARQMSHYWYAVNGKNGEVGRGASLSAVEALAGCGEISLDEWVSESYGGRNLFVHMLSGHPAVDASSLETAQFNLRRHIKVAGACDDMSGFLLRLCGKTDLKLPFYIETNKTDNSSRDRTRLSEWARQKFIEENQLDYALFNEVKKNIEYEAQAAEGPFLKAIELVRSVQAEINKLENPYLHASTIFGFEAEYLAKVRNVIAEFDLRPIEEYIASEQNRQADLFDMHDGFVDAVRDGVVSGWAVNLHHPEEKVLIEVRVGDEVVATGWSGAHRPDVREAGYGTAYAGFSIPLPDQALDGFHVTIAHSHEPLHNGGTWRQGWHAA
jgi:hypothetical protein